MKKLSHEISRKGDAVKVEANWRTRMRTPAKVAVVADNQSTSKDSTLAEGEAADVFDTLSGIAELAWDMGWRPRGLDLVVSGVVKSYKIPEG
jgi:hypothetical protein